MALPVPAGLKFFSILLLALYPFLVWFGLSSGQHMLLGFVLVVLFGLRFSLLRNLLPELQKIGQLGAVVGVLLVSASLLLERQALLLYYPVAVNGIFLLLFATSLLTEQSLVERLARLREPDLPADGVSYTRRVTQAWCVFFILNGSIALVTVLLQDVRLWALYNGFISYLLIALMMGVEWIVRRKVRNRKATNPLS
ncbi:MAG: hypothetical protein IBX50_09155 [Marinospirillum sp.]|uniref:COG4648 family protein n=1 Tax=Marinospirillum sp. TaxID=2183934 RepID=UPI0019DBFE05|nr:hypothetical protein [Marinospirillum sp.]MBE0506870.1 hypothetical protein [Marinospirillum sp.]